MKKKADSKTVRKTRSNTVAIANSPSILLNNINKLIDEAKNHIARGHNSTQALLCWWIRHFSNANLPY